MEINLKNNEASVSVDLNGGAIVDFHLSGHDVNPLSFRFLKDQMPENNKSGAVYQGHFACIGRWGEPSAGEIQAGHPNHGFSAISLWREVRRDDKTITLDITTALEGLKTIKTLTISDTAAAFEVTEKFKNTHTSGRLFNVVQHPTLAAPFLNKHTRVDSNATQGINYNFNKHPLEYASQWPNGLCEDGRVINLNVPDIIHDGVFSFIIDKTAEHGWVTAWSPEHSLLLGYVWKREQYPWLDVWQHFADGELKYRGIEFGTTGVHKSVPDMLECDAFKVYGEKTVSYLDAGEEVSRSYGAFLFKTGPDFTGVDGISVKSGNVLIQPKLGESIELQTGFKAL
ncbi:hypothetical protein DJ568_13770 [Mucilaginibacter hurinus]|uniref:Aldose 1-epimerase n=1 Tax=Mucilaginibacter hurinus TaxID=2201324 RepID=A0A367GNV9_9SPHI|nr:hypothetical protein [Mucilaginibacter hurinus]RCH54351.1 hypothetical protein DJ568_13770 [Mucilaginibacter hurinus]